MDGYLTVQFVNLIDLDIDVDSDIWKLQKFIKLQIKDFFIKQDFFLILIFFCDFIAMVTI
jgi:hypothetical protein